MHCTTDALALRHKHGEPACGTHVAETEVTERQRCLKPLHWRYQDSGAYVGGEVHVCMYMYVVIDAPGPQPRQRTTRDGDDRSFAGSALIEDNAPTLITGPCFSNNGEIERVRAQAWPVAMEFEGSNPSAKKVANFWKTRSAEWRRVVVAGRYATEGSPAREGRSSILRAPGILDQATPIIVTGGPYLR